MVYRIIEFNCWIFSMSARGSAKVGSGFRVRALIEMRTVDCRVGTMGALSQ